MEPPSPLDRTFSTRVVRVEGTSPAVLVAPAPRETRTPSLRPPARVPVPTEPAAPPVRTLVLPEPAPQPSAAEPAPAPPPEPAVVAAPVPVSPGSAPAAAGPATAALSIPGSTRLKYNVNGEVKGMAYTANAELLWLHDGARYDARLEVGAALGRSRVQTSSGRLTTAGLAPTRFSDRSRSEVAAHFDAEKGRVTFSGNREPATLEAGAQDRLSIFLQLTALLAGDPARYPAGTEIAVQTIGPNLAEPWIFRVEGMETVRLPDREIPALKLSRSQRHPYDTRADLWFAPSLDYLPARIRLTLANGDSLEQLLRSADKP
ncbi:MAG: DUF3108 domain-containing protein [Burkholderiaceae bacterium]